MIKNLFTWKRRPQGLPADARKAALPTASEGEAGPSVLDAGDSPTSHQEEWQDRGPSPEQIAARAYELWVRRGSPEGAGHEDWLEAERQLNQERTSQPGQPDRAR